jgi:hypothetical protein
MPLSCGTRLGPYEILAAIGAGGMGEVYKARDTRLDRDVAIKVLPAGATSDPERRHRFELEARAVSALNHPHICVLYDIGSERPVLPTGAAASAPDGPVPFLVMEYLDGQTLAQRLRKGPLPRTQVLELGAQIADALATAHRRGIVHRDLKPANIMLGKAGAKLLDFGLAKLRPQASAPGTGLSALSTQAPATMPGAVMGTVPYMAPEQLEGKETDARTDLFAFGCVVYEMLTARRAFGGDTEASVISAIMTGEPPPLSSLQPLTPPALDRLVRRCLAKDPDDRWQHAADVAEELRGISQDSIAPAATRTAQLGKRRAWTLAAVVTVVALAGAALVWVAGDRLWPRAPAPVHFALAMPGRTVLNVGTGSELLAVSSDARGVVYTGTTGVDQSQWQLYWQELSGREGWALPGTEGARDPVLSPDGRWVGFWRDGKILKLPLREGRVVEGSPISEVATTGEALRGASWGGDGTIVYSSYADGLWRVAADGGEPRQLTRPDASKYELSHRWPSFLPGGRDVLFTVLHASNRADRSAIAVLSLETGRWQRIVEGGVYARYLPSGHLVFARDGTLLAVPFDTKTLTVTGSAVPVLNEVQFSLTITGFDVAADGTVVYAHQKVASPSNALVWITREGEPEPLALDRQAYQPASFALSRDGRRLAAVIDGDPYSNIWVCDLGDCRWQRLNVQGDCNFPVWSPAGDRLAFNSNRDGVWNLYTVAADGESPPVRLTESGNVQNPSSWSRDGRFLAYQEQVAGARFETYVLPLDGGTTPQRWGPEGDNRMLPVFSPDGRWLAFQAMDESGKFDVYVQPFPGLGLKQRISGREGGFAPVWSSDGQEIYYVERLKDTSIRSRRVESSAPLRLAAPRVAFALPFALSNPAYWGSRAFAVAPDGRRVLVVQADQQAPRDDINTLHVIRHWPEEVKAKLRGGQ